MRTSLRRFAFKVRFNYLNADQRWRMFVAEFERLGGDGKQASEVEALVRRLEGLTPGDFAAALRQVELGDEATNARRLHAALRKECEAKGAPRQRIGFAA